MSCPPLVTGGSVSQTSYFEALRVCPRFDQLSELVGFDFSSQKILIGVRVAHRIRTGTACVE